MAKKTSDHDEPLLTLSELATYLHLDENTVLKLASAGKIPGIPIEKNWRCNSVSSAGRSGPSAAMACRSSIR